MHFLQCLIFSTCLFYFSVGCLPTPQLEQELISPTCGLNYRPFERVCVKAESLVDRTGQFVPNTYESLPCSTTIYLMCPAGTQAIIAISQTTNVQVPGTTVLKCNQDTLKFEFMDATGMTQVPYLPADGSGNINCA